MDTKKCYSYWLSSFLLVLLGACTNQKQEPHTARLGEAHLAVTGAEQALPFFKEGLLLLHSFEYEDAREKFLKAQEIDPAFAMAFWGEAMTYNHAIWHRQDFEKGKAALEKLGPNSEERSAKAGSGLERDFLQAAEILFGEGDKVDRDKAYSNFMETLYKKHPGNHEVAAFYALSLLGAVPVGRDDEVYGLSAIIAQGILKENPNHPGALHYLIHSYDDPVHAHLARNAADSYSKVATDAAHALHMPSHIYVALGMWDEVVSSNIDSWNASVDRMKRKELDNDAQSYHALHWLLYGYLQKGKIDEARQIMRDMEQYTRELPSKQARGYLTDMKGNYLVESGDWAGEIADIEVDQDNLNIVHQAVNYFIEGMKAYLKKDGVALEEIIGKMEKDWKKAALFVDDRGVPMCSGAGSPGALPNQLDIDQARVMELELRALQAWMNGRDKNAEELLVAATKLEQSISYAYGPPPIVKPSFELYGDWLLEKGRPEEALKQYEASLKRGPERRLALEGKLKAEKMMSKES
jgi:tetratricopeptide (TPR) repeat protein